MRRFAISKSATFKMVNEVIDAICKSTSVGSAKFPTTEEECDRLATGFVARSGLHNDRGLITSAVGMIDGMLVRARSPSHKETKNATAF